MSKVAILFAFVGLTIMRSCKLVISEKGLCMKHQSTNSSVLCREYLEMKNDGLLRHCDDKVRLLSCKNRCDNPEERKEEWKQCFCDSKCSSLGDCCIDYFPWCDDNKDVLTPIECVIPPRSKSAKGYIMIGKCRNTWKNNAVEKRCRSQNETDPVATVPVYDYKRNTTFANVFCAICNDVYVTNITYWKMKVNFPNKIERDSARNKSLQLLLNIYNWSVVPHPPRSAKFCIPQPGAMLANDYKLPTKFNYTLRFLCRKYVLPVQTFPDPKQFRNPHCGRLSSVQTQNFSCCYPTGTRSTFHQSFSLIFSFNPKGSQILGESALSDKPKTTEVSVPFEVLCMHFLDKYSSISLTRYNRNDTQCPRCFAFNIADVVMYDNGTVFLPPRRALYNNDSYILINNTILFCANVTKGEARFSSISSRNSSVSSVLTIIGSVVSLTSLVFFLMTRFLFQELRSLYGRNLISLSCALLTFQVLFLVSDQSQTGVVCDVITGILHYTLLAMFAWMSAVAYDVSNTLTSKASAELSRGEENKKFCMYCLFAWGMPLVIVIAGIILGFSRALEMGYGSNGERYYCYLSPTGRIYFTAIPIGVSLLFNTVALISTALAVRKVRKGVNDGNKYRPHSSLLVLCVKLASVMGVMWLLGFVYAASDNIYVEYIFVVICSLQGFFICVCFGMNKQTRDLYKSKFDCRKSVATNPRKQPQLHRLTVTECST